MRVRAHKPETRMADPNKAETGVAGRTIQLVIPANAGISRTHEARSHGGHSAEIPGQARDGRRADDSA